MANERLRTVDAGEARELLETARVGHLAYDGAEGVDATPVNFRVDGDRVVVRTADDSALARAERPQRVVMLVTYLERLAQKAWSVKVRGTLSEPPPEALPEVEPAPWTGAPGTVLLEISLDEITGRRVG
ncbi:nitroimidazol reductase NimA-like FMN-containing flavoprotein (pyridoxamine 5'-phosphate oxidase superfamily) [Mumia flava]|uniref:Nitroimidazol reductase NimA-like FMN-containing flavoprotein (Pyridoxamine 5'-phosphate oxidase superfamily) n=1 Tax=Mumia flava TaxID=1348852 RepID=A0A0B2BTI3_9ACTN|nr:pyridoxamine 5'-phosphate oxidase family protein [Mumia flava]PJJ57205.1 nitroimidazol reductase NimA-like FMN-containing flavoprotein (pyridoxamine 5'-phosphate oxidase superfamily) [Mumia flava]